MTTKVRSTAGVRQHLAYSYPLAPHWVQMIFVNYKSGRRLNGFLLALGDRTIRVAIQGSDDAVEFRMVNGLWISEDCEIVTFDFAEQGFEEQQDRDVPEAIFAGESQAPIAERIM
jgi:hypothetical protein